MEVAHIIRKIFLGMVVGTLVQSKPFGTRWTQVQILPLYARVAGGAIVGSVSTTDYLVLFMGAIITPIPQPSSLLPGIYPTDNTHAQGKQRTHRLFIAALFLELQ